MARLGTVFVVLMLGVVSTLSFSQRGVLSQGGITLELKFYIPNGTVPRTTRVELIFQGTPMGESVVDSSGTVTFGMLRDGIYSARVSGPDIQTASYDFRIMPGEPEHVETFQLRPNKPGTNPVSPGAVSALELNVPPNARKEIELASEALKRQDWAQARKHCERAVEIYPGFVSAYNELGVILIRLGDREHARDALQKAISLDPKYIRPYINLARMDAADHKYSEAEELLTKAVAGDPQNAEGLFLLANSQFENGHYDNAIASARKVHALSHHGFEAAHFICAAALEAQHRSTEAAEEYRLFLQEAPDSKMAPKARAALQSLDNSAKTQ